MTCKDCIHSGLCYKENDYENFPKVCGSFMPETSRGEWIAREDMDYLDDNKVVHNHFECNKCGLIHDFIDGHTSQYNFCPNCGAKMVFGAENCS